MNLRTYQAYTLNEALAAVKTDLGADAVILHTRSFRRGGLLGLGRRTVIEVTATTATEARSADAHDRSAPAGDRDPHGRGARPGSAAALRAYGRQRSTSRFDADSAPAAGSVSDADRLRTRRLAQAMAEQHQRASPPLAPGTSHSAPKPAALPRSTQRGETSPSGGPGPVVQAPLPPPPAARRFFLTAPGAPPETAWPQPPSQPAAAIVEPKPVQARVRSDALQDELSAIREMVSQVLQRQTAAEIQGRQRRTEVLEPPTPRSLFELYLRLIGQEVSEDLAAQVIESIRRELGPERIDDHRAVREAALRHLARLVPSAEPAGPRESAPGRSGDPDGRPLTIALVGPTGVGKTTTVAKLAASFKLRHGKRTGLITADTYRIAAVDQLRTYAEIIGVPLEVALTPAEMTEAVARLAGCDVIIIDTAGRGQNDSSRLDELRRFVAAARPHEVHLVLSSTAGERVLLKEAEAFSVIGPTRIVLTKLDEAVSFGVLINVMRALGKQLSFVTTGQEVPDDIELGRPEQLAALVVGGEEAAASRDEARA